VSALGLSQPTLDSATMLAWTTLVVAVAAGLGMLPRLTLSLLFPLLLLEEALVVSAGKVGHGTIPLVYAAGLLAVVAWTGSRARWFFDVMYLELAAFYGGAGLSKLLDAGPAWADGYSLQYFLLDKGLPAGAWLATRLDLCRAASVLVLAWELGFVLGVFRRLRPIFLAGGVLFHAATTAFLGVSFFSVVALYALFVPWAALAARLSSMTRPGKATEVRA